MFAGICRTSRRNNILLFNTNVQLISKKASICRTFPGKSAKVDAIYRKCGRIIFRANVVLQENAGPPGGTNFRFNWELHCKSPKKLGYARIFGPLAQKLAPTATLAGINVGLSHVAQVILPSKACICGTFRPHPAATSSGHIQRPHPAHT